MVKTSEGINWLIEQLRKDQSPDGSWSYPFETGLVTDAYMIILLRSLEIDDEELVRGLTERIIQKQEKNGAWKLFFDEGEGNLSTTIECYYALLYSGYYHKEDPRIRLAKKFILASGGLEEAGMFTKVMLAVTGQYQWPAFSPLPAEVILLPIQFPINFYSISIFGRANLTPILILFDKKFSIKYEKTPGLSDLYVNRNFEDPWIRSTEFRSLLSFLHESVKSLVGLPMEIHNLAIDRLKKYMINHLEPDGTFYSYFSSTYLMIFALLSLGYKKSDSLIANAIEGLKSMKCEINGLPHMQYTTANVWNTALIGYALQGAGISNEDPMVERANQYLISKQHHKFGDWVIHNPQTLPGGWGFSDINTINPDVDDTTAALRSLSKHALRDLSPWDRGLHWLFSMQNDDGGWAAFEKNVESKILEFIPIEKSRFIISDASSADLTGRTLEFLGNYTNLSKVHETVGKGVKWLRKNQEKNGSWYGRWGICYIYGTWAAITGLTAVNAAADQEVIVKGVKWLESIQNQDGGWGESCHSDIRNTYIPLNASTLTHTAWSLDALIAAANRPTTAIHNGIKYLLENLQKNDWTKAYPKGQGMGGTFYIHYHSYRYIFPLITLSRYQRKFEI